MTYTLHTLRPAAKSRRRSKYIGRGNASGHGTFSTRGSKGQRARSGGKSGLKQKGMKRIIASLPKLGGFRSLRVKPKTLRIDLVSAAFKEGQIVNLRSLKERGLVPASVRNVKIVGNAEVKKKLTIHGIKVSEGTKAIVTMAGGEVR